MSAQGRALPPIAIQPLRDSDPRQFGDFRVIGRLGAGGMGEAFLAEGPDTWLVVKTVRAGTPDTEELAARMRHEVEAMRSVNSPLVAAIIADELDADRPWFAMEFVPGLNLHQRVSQFGPVPPGELPALGLGLARCIEAVHAVNVVHRDLKPDNVVLDTPGPRLIDFGTAEVSGATHLTAVGNVVGTMLWMSPEQVSGGQTTAAADVHAWGLLMIYAATGSIPFEAESSVATMYRALNYSPPIPAVLGQPLGGLVARALAKDPGQRPHASEIVRDLSEALGVAQLPPGAAPGMVAMAPIPLPGALPGYPPPGMPPGTPPAGTPIPDYLNFPPPSPAQPVGQPPAQPLPPAAPVYQPTPPPAAQTPPGGYPVGQPGWQTPPGGYAMGQMANPMGQVPPGQTPPGGYPVGQTPPGGYPMGQTPPGGYPVGQMGQVPPGQTPPGGYPIAAGQTPPGGYPAAGYPGGGTPSQPPYYGYPAAAGGSPKKGRRGLMVLLAVVPLLLVVGFGGWWFLGRGEDSSAGGDTSASASPTDASPDATGSASGSTSPKPADNSVAATASPVKVTMSDGLKGNSIVRLSVGDTSACVVADNGRAYCWGSNAEGQLGSAGGGSNKPRAVETGGVLKGEQLERLSTGGRHSCVVSDSGRAFCWGANDKGQLGTGSTGAPSDQPVAVDTSGALSGKTLARIGATGDTTCASDTGGQMYCWGDNSNGQFGNGTTDNSATPVPVDTSSGLGSGKATSFSVGDDHTCTVIDTGAAYCWGRNDKGQLGNGSKKDSLVPVAVQVPDDPTYSFSGISAGGSGTCAYGDDATLRCWGSGENGELGSGSTKATADPTVVVFGPTQNFNGADQVNHGGDTVCTADQAFNAFCWGNGTSGELGNGKSESSPTPVGVKGKGAPGWVHVGVGDSTVCAIGDDGSAWCWGSNSNGLLGAGLAVPSS